MLVIVFTLFIITPSPVRGQGRNSQRWYKYKYRLGFKTKKTLGYVLVSFKRQKKPCGVILRILVKENFISFSKILEKLSFKLKFNVTFFFHKMRLWFYPMNSYAITYKLIFNVFLDCLYVQRTFWNSNIEKITNHEAVWVQVILTSF